MTPEEDFGLVHTDQRPWDKRDAERMRSWMQFLKENVGKWNADSGIAAHYVPLMLAALDARDALLREVLAYLGTCYAEGEAPEVLEPKIRAVLGEKP